MDDKLVNFIDDNSKGIEFLVAQHDKFFDDIKRSIEIVKDFIISKGLIVYGGTAIDYALRLEGDKIYPDDALAVPDLDFYSTDNVADSYELADKLFEEGWEDARSINAEYARTMRVDIGGKHFIADITFLPKSVFEKMPTIDYAGMKIVHPNFQRIDLHSSLSMPFANPPREVIFARWSKDIKRFNLIDKYYPVESSADAKLMKTKFPLKTRKFVLTGFAAYSLIYAESKKLLPEISKSKDILAAEFNDDDNEIEFSTFDSRVELVSIDPPKTFAYLFDKSENYTSYEPYFNMIPPKIVAKKKFYGNVTIFSAKNQLISVNSAGDENRRIRITNIQYLLKYFLSMSYIDGDAVYLAAYTSLLRLINLFEDKGIENHLVDLSVKIYGSDNINLARQIGLNRIRVELGEEAPLSLPQNYYPGRSRKNNRPRPQFDHTTLEFFHEEGLEIIGRNEQKDAKVHDERGEAGSAM